MSTIRPTPTRVPSGGLPLEPVSDGSIVPETASTGADGLELGLRDAVGLGADVALADAEPEGLALPLAVASGVAVAASVEPALDGAVGGFVRVGLAVGVGEGVGRGVRLGVGLAVGWAGAAGGATPGGVAAPPDWNDHPSTPPGSGL